MRRPILGKPGHDGGSGHKKEQGDAYERLIFDKFAFHGFAVALAETNQPGYDLIIHRMISGPRQRVQVKSRDYSVPTNFFGWYDVDEFDWLAAVLVNPPSRDCRIFIAPREIIDARAHYAKFREGRSFTAKNISRKLAEYEDNFDLAFKGRPLS